MKKANQGCQYGQATSRARHPNNAKTQPQNPKSTQHPNPRNTQKKKKKKKHPTKTKGVSVLIGRGNAGVKQTGLKPQARQWIRSTTQTEWGENISLSTPTVPQESRKPVEDKQRHRVEPFTPTYVTDRGASFAVKPGVPRRPSVQSVVDLVRQAERLGIEKECVKRRTPGRNFKLRTRTSGRKTKNAEN